MSIETEEKVGFKAPIVMSSLGLLVLVLLGFLGRDGMVAFEISRRNDAVQLPAIDVDSSTLGIFAGLVMLAISGFALWRSMQNKRTPIWVLTVYGAVGITVLLGWLAAGATVPVTFIAGTALVLAVPIILGAMGGVMSERVGITNIAIEGQLLSGAFMAAVVSSITGSFTLGIIAAMVTAALMSMIFLAYITQYPFKYSFLMDQIH